MAGSPNPFATTGRSRKGEPLVWLTAAGLTIGVILTLGLLGLVVTKGFQSFWPGPLLVLDVTTDDGVAKVAGFEAQKRYRRDLDGVQHEEVQIYRGNRELHGDKFVYLDVADIAASERPEDLLLIERLEGGSVIGRAKALELEEGGTLAADVPDFRERLASLTELADERRGALEKIEKDEIGRNAKRVRELTQRRQLIGESQAPGPVAEIDRELEILQAEFGKLDAERKEIRERLEADRLIVEAADGREVTVPALDLMHVFRPNEAGFFGKLLETVRRIWTFLSSDPREANMEGGVYPAIFGTVVMTLFMSLFVTPFGVIAAIYLREYAKQGPLVRAVRISVNNLAGVPSIVFGVFGLAFFIYFVGDLVDTTFFPNAEEPVYKSGGILWASLTLALLTVPVVIVATEEALAAVPRGVREAALACGASKWQTIQRVVLPASLPGILTGVILAMARGAGEVAPLMLVGVVKLAPDLPIDGVAPFIHAERQFMHLGFHIYDLGFQSPDSEAAKPMVFATTLLLIVLVVLMNLAAIVLRNRIRKKFATSSF